MKAVREMRAQVEAMDLAAQRTKRAASPELSAAELDELRQWRLASACRYVGKSIDVLGHPVKKGQR